MVKKKRQVKDREVERLIGTDISEIRKIINEREADDQAEKWGFKRRYEDYNL